MDEGRLDDLDDAIMVVEGLFHVAVGHCPAEGPGHVLEGVCGAEHGEDD